MELFPNRGYFFCQYCSSFHFPETATPDGVRVLAEAKGLMCPVCKRTLSTGLLDEAHPVHYCTNCRGVLLPRNAFADIVRVRRAWATGVPAKPLPPQPSEFERTAACPMCTRAFQTHPYYGPGNVIIDSCAHCDVIWLDFGELKQIVDAPGGDRGSRGAAEARKKDWTPDATNTRPLMNRGEGRRGRVDLLDVLGTILFDR